ncbi:MAG: VPLPA-CTERM-specific exosortase XrtD [Nitrospiraceae bacterium]
MAATIGLLTVAYHDSLRFLLSIWLKDDNYSHGLLVPFISAYLIWSLRDRMLARPVVGAEWGLALMGVATVLYLVGELATLYSLLHVSFALQLVGLFICMQGLVRAWQAAFPLAYLFTAIPLPMFIYQNVTGTLQLWSSSLGIGVLQLLGVTAYQEGNVIDLGTVQLQVVEACSGLRYLFPLVSLSCLAAYLLRDRWWKRIVLVLASIPVAILLNGLRIGMVGMLVEWTGPSAADGALHLVEGWVLFLLSVAALFVVMTILKRVGAPIQAQSHEQSVRIDADTRSSGMVPAFVALALGVCLFALSTQLTERQDRIPSRQSFLDFPQEVGPWHGQPYPLEDTFLAALKLDDYYLGDFQQPSGAGVNLYVAYYQSQRKGQSAHSPQSCIPGGGWEISSLTTAAVPVGGTTQHTIAVNRAVVQKQAERQLVYYWFKQRERALASEYLVKWFILWDGLIRHRTDGALIRLVTPILAGEQEAAADARLRAMGESVTSLLTAYVPD